jgi:hypothetical protein
MGRGIFPFVINIICHLSSVSSLVHCFQRIFYQHYSVQAIAFYGCIRSSRKLTCRALIHTLSTESHKRKPLRPEHPPQQPPSQAWPDHMEALAQQKPLPCNGAATVACARQDRPPTATQPASGRAGCKAHRFVTTCNVYTAEPHPFCHLHTSV